MASYQPLSRHSHDFCMMFSAKAGVAGPPGSFPFTPEPAGKQLGRQQHHAGVNMDVGHPVTSLGHLRHQTGVPPALIFPFLPRGSTPCWALLCSSGVKQRVLQLKSLHLPSQKNFCWIFGDLVSTNFPCLCSRLKSSGREGGLGHLHGNVVVGRLICAPRGGCSY